MSLTKGVESPRSEAVMEQSRKSKSESYVTIRFATYFTGKLGISPAFRNLVSLIQKDIACKSLLLSTNDRALGSENPLIPKYLI